VAGGDFRVGDDAKIEPGTINCERSRFANYPVLHQLPSLALIDAQPYEGAPLAWFCGRLHHNALIWGRKRPHAILSRQQ
jgi:hypothetical protein